MRIAFTGRNGAGFSCWGPSTLVYGHGGFAFLWLFMLGVSEHKYRKPCGYVLAGAAHGSVQVS